MLMCPECGLTRKIYNHHAVDDMFLHVLKNHLPHQHCKNEDCECYRYNLYEYYGEYYERANAMPEEEEEFENYKYLVKCKCVSSGLPPGPLGGSMTSVIG